MTAVFKREFSSAFSRLYGYLIVGGASITATVIFCFYNLVYTVETVNSTYSMISVAMALIIPLVAINAFCDRKKGNADAQYDVVPTKTSCVVLGKYFASLTLIMIPTALTGFFPLIAGFYSVQDHAQSYVAFLFLVLFEAAWLAVCFFITKLSKSRLRAAIWCYAVGVLWFFSGVLTYLIPLAPIASLIAFVVFIAAVGGALYFVTKRLVFSIVVTAVAEAVTVACYFIFTSFFSGLFEAFIRSVSIFRHYETVSYGLFEIEGVLFFLVVTVLFVFLAWGVHERSYQKKATQMPMCIKKATSLCLALVLALASLGVTVAAAIVPDTALTYDISGSKRSTVSKEAKSFLSGVDKDVTIYVLEFTGLENYELYLEKLAACNPKIHLEKVFYSSNAAFFTKHGLSLDSITANSLVIECGDNAQYVSYYDLCKYANPTFGITECTYTQYASYAYQVALNYSNDQATVMAFELGMETYFNGDTVICETVEYVTADVIPTWYYLDGHEELGLDSAANPFAGATALTLDEKIPDDAAAILINMPKNDITEVERDVLLDYLAKGGQLTVVTTPENLSMPNLCAVLSAYGLSAENRTVEVSVTETVKNEGGESEEKTTHTEEFVPVINSNNDVFYLLSELSDFDSTIKGANPIIFNQDTAKVEMLTDIPLLTTKAEDGEATYTVARAVEAPSGAKLVLFTAGKSINDVASDTYVFPLLALEWVTLKFQSNSPTVPARLYVPSSSAVTSMTAILIPVVIIILALAFMTLGGVMYYRRRHGK